jgi:hypothetical protein
MKVGYIYFPSPRQLCALHLYTMLEIFQLRGNGNTSDEQTAQSVLTLLEFTVSYDSLNEKQWAC